MRRQSNGYDVSMGDGAIRVRSVEAAASASTGGGAVIARSVEGAASVSTDEYAVSAWSAEAAGFVSTVGGAPLARIVKHQTSLLRLTSLLRHCSQMDFGNTPLP